MQTEEPFMLRYKHVFQLYLGGPHSNIKFHCPHSYWLPRKTIPAGPGTARRDVPSAYKGGAEAHTQTRAARVKTRSIPADTNGILPVASECLGSGPYQMIHFSTGLKQKMPHALGFSNKKITFL